MNKKLIGIIVIVLIIVGAIWYRNHTLDFNNPAINALVKHVTQGEVEVVKRFHLIGDLEGLVVRAKGDKSKDGLIFVNRKGQYLITGSVIDGKGQNLTEQAYQKYIVSPAQHNIFKMASKTTWIEQGKDSAKHKVYVLVDPNCIFCHHLFEGLQKQISQGNIQVRWIVVGFLKPSSRGKALAILSANDSLKAMIENEKGFKDQVEEGGIKPLNGASPKAIASLEQNARFMTDNKLSATPASIYRNVDGNIKVVLGFPKTYLSDITQMGDQFD